MGDRVVYLRQGHEAAVAADAGSRNRPRASDCPWLRLPELRPAEPCIITGIRYAIDGASRRPFGAPEGERVHYTSAM